MSVQMYKSNEAGGVDLQNFDNNAHIQALIDGWVFNRDGEPVQVEGSEEARQEATEPETSDVEINKEREGPATESTAMEVLNDLSDEEIRALGKKHGIRSSHNMGIEKLKVKLTEV